MVVKNKPGRPKKIVRNQHPVKGIVSEPASKDNRIELFYEDPRVFKRIFSIFKAYETSEIELRFEKDRIYATGIDHEEKINVVVELNGSGMNSYWCDEPLVLLIRRESIDKIFNTIGKFEVGISLIVRKANDCSLYILIRACEYKYEEYFNIEVIPQILPKYTVKYEEQDHDLKFVVITEYIKKKVNDIKRLSKTLTIQKKPDSPLQLIFDNPTKKISYNGIFIDTDRVYVKDNSKLFHASIPIDSIRPFTNLNIGTDVVVMIGPGSKMVIKTEIIGDVDRHICNVAIVTGI